MAEKPEDLNLPNAVITRLVKEGLPEGVTVSKEARSAIGKSASVFILFVTAAANGFAEQAKRKTLNANDVLSGLEEMELQNYVQPLKSFLTEYKDHAATKKKQAATKTTASSIDVVQSNGDKEDQPSRNAIDEDEDEQSSHHVPESEKEAALE